VWRKKDYLHAYNNRH